MGIIEEHALNLQPLGDKVGVVAQGKCALKASVLLVLITCMAQFSQNIVTIGLCTKERTVRVLCKDVLISLATVIIGCDEQARGLHVGWRNGSDSRYTRTSTIGSTATRAELGPEALGDVDANVRPNAVLAESILGTVGSF